MDKKNICNYLVDILTEENVKKNELMSKHTTFKIGGPADLFVRIKTVNQLEKTLNILKQCDNMPYKIIGNGSNILVRDEGYRGVIIKNEIDDIEMKDNNIIDVSSGAKLAIIANQCLKNKIEGFEFASGIPGTIGGAIKMNAGAHGKEMKDIIESVTYLDDSGKLNKISNEECQFNYRKSIFSLNNYIIIKAELKLKKGNEQEIKQKMNEYKMYRKEKQPIEFSSAGSTFKRGENFITAKLIDEAGLKGYSIGGAQVSNKHAGFIVNTGNASADDVIRLIKHIQKVILTKYNKNLELEIEII